MTVFNDGQIISYWGGKTNRLPMKFILLKHDRTIGQYTADKFMNKENYLNIQTFYKKLEKQ